MPHGITSTGRGMHMHMACQASKPSVIIIVTLSVPPLLPPAGCDCSNLRLSASDKPVCDADGVVYVSACLAKCQGVDAEPCAGGCSVSMDAPTWVHGWLEGDHLTTHQSGVTVDPAHETSPPPVSLPPSTARHS